MRKNKNVYPRGWDEERVRKLVEYYDNQTDEEAVREFEASINESSQTFMSVPTELVPAIRAFISSATTKRKPAGRARKAPTESRNRRQMV